jgi:hypothetical protein
MEQTAVEYAIQEIEKLAGIKISRDEDCVIKAKEMFEQQIKDAYQTSHISMMTANQYYNEKFKNK